MTSHQQARQFRINSNKLALNDIIQRDTQTVAHLMQQLNAWICFAVFDIADGSHIDA